MNFRAYIKGIINERKEEMKKPDFHQEREDFLTLLLNDDLFQNDIEVIIDECVTFMFAAT
jgi:cytochrome P450